MEQPRWNCAAMQKGRGRVISLLAATFLLLPRLLNVGGICRAGAGNISPARWLFLTVRTRLNAINTDRTKTRPRFVR